jgi:methanogenic corrinoid protein MtbC1/DNA-binding XRE family transcriptional regulator
MTIPSHRLAPRLIQALLTADAQEVSAVISRAIEGGLGLEAVYLELLSPAQEEVGERWARGLITIAQEHLATDLVRRHMDALRERFPAHTSNGRTVLVGTVQPEQHEIGAHMVADLLALDGWSVHVLTNVPPGEFAVYAASLAPDLVALSVMLDSSVAAAQEALELLRARLPGVPVLTGGPAGQDLGADGAAPNAREARRVARELAGPPAEAYPLEPLLRRVGAHLQAARRARGWSQQHLAEASGVDRTYLSGLENGRQNPTLGVLLKVAEALEVNIETLMEAR